MTAEELQALADKTRNEAIAQLHVLFQVPADHENTGITKFVDLTIAAAVMNLTIVMKQTGLG